MPRRSLLPFPLPTLLFFCLWSSGLPCSLPEPSATITRFLFLSSFMSVYTAATATEAIIIPLLALQVANTVSIAQLMNDALILARDKNYDVFNALDILQVMRPFLLCVSPLLGAPGMPLAGLLTLLCPTQNKEYLKELKFGPGDGHLQYYLYNYRVAGGLKPEEVGLVLL